MLLDMKEMYYEAIAQMFKSHPRAVRYAHAGIKAVQVARENKKRARDCKGLIKRVTRELYCTGKSYLYNKEAALWFQSKGYSVTNVDGDSYVVSVEVSEKELNNIMMKQ